MPLWIIYHPPETFTSPTTKQALAAEITSIYTAASLPAFYVNVLFIPIPPSSFFIGGSNPPGQDSSKPWIRITIQNIARKIPNPVVRDRFLARVDQALKPYIQDAGYDWEYSVEETSRELWKIDGFVPPMPGSEAEREWVARNSPGEFERGRGGLL
ncbi:hypothetical protein K491DRAFT_585581 [Lophiostoma macrostomum CBS 122681]|uniref:Tautomerase cis-CaaD-like domain-containing protein n=1 Tax=Lophiostoma macrostomum CBS 122681 TaxID=1314788 RepID=A0A6A6TT65_9PLEO|nr:hypothetical protein K491DRAFT_585581 [Lophiostoma macrostomum CBS 122681]